MEHVHKSVGKASDLCSAYPGQTSGLEAEVENVEKMLSGSTLYAEVTSEERMAVISAMASGFLGTGHW
jgi:TPP-dependent indolepyruvate ferredoxin oxidoreductase alpha subunit